MTALPDWLPAAEDVREEMVGRKQALDRIGNPEIEGLIARRYDSLSAEVPRVLPAHLHGAGRAYLVLSVAAQLEDRLFPEQSSLSGSNAERLDRRAGAELARLRTGLASGDSDGRVEWSGTLSMGGR